MSVVYQSVKKSSLAKAELKEDHLKKSDSQNPVEGHNKIVIKANNNRKYHYRASDIQGTAMSYLDISTQATFTSLWIGSIMVSMLQGRMLKHRETLHNLPKTTWPVGTEAGT